MHLIAPLYLNPNLNRKYTAPILSQSLFGTRYWLITLAFSFLLHLLVMYALPWFIQTSVQPASPSGVTASFKVLPSPTPTVVETLPVISPVPETPIPPLEPVKPTQKQKVTPKSEPVLQAQDMAQPEDYAVTEQISTVEAETPIAPEVPHISSPAEISKVPSAPAASTQSTSPLVNPTSSARTSQDSGLADAYGRDLQRLCERNKQYPSIAIRRSLEGAGSVLVEFNKDGKVLRISIEESTGQQSLDEQAVKMVEKSLKVLPLPTKLSGHVLTLSIPVSFKLEG
jgi:periplasmic protein TonB